MKLLGFTAVLASVWLLLSGHYTPLILVCGALSCALVTWIAQRMDVVDREGHPVHLTLKMPMYWLWLLAEIMKSSWSVCKLIMSPKLNIEPVVERIAVTQHSDLTRATFANSITLTPGTLAMTLSKDSVEVHALRPEYLDALRNGTFGRRSVDLEA